MDGRGLTARHENTCEGRAECHSVPAEQKLAQEGFLDEVTKDGTEKGRPTIERNSLWRP